MSTTMEARPGASLFNRRSHNPSFFAVRDSRACEGDPLDFCVPVNPHFPPPALLEMIHRDLGEILKYYPDYAEVHEKHIGELTGLAPETLVACNGSTEIITLLCREARGPLVTSVPTFGRWTDLPPELDVPLHTIPRRRENAFRLEVDEIIDRVREAGARTLVISNPNNPTGAWLTGDEVKALTRALPDLDALIIDESFIDFSDSESVAEHAAVTHNLVVVKSLGKSLGWHGVRLGYAVAEPGRARALRAQLPFWNINGLAAYVLKHVPRFRAELRASFARTAEDRADMAERLGDVPGLTVYPSQANFLFLELPEGVSGRALRDRLLQRHGVMVRECSNKVGSTEQYLRVAVLRREAAAVLVRALREELAPYAAASSIRKAAIPRS